MMSASFAIEATRPISAKTIKKPATAKRMIENNCLLSFWPWVLELLEIEFGEIGAGVIVSDSGVGVGSETGDGAGAGVGAGVGVGSSVDSGAGSAVSSVFGASATGSLAGVDSVAGASVASSSNEIVTGDSSTSFVDSKLLSIVVLFSPELSIQPPIFILLYQKNRI
jgi:hypothetical protein